MKNWFLKKRKKINVFLKSLFWFSIGIGLGLFFLISSTIIIFQKLYATTIYPGITVNGIHFGGKTKQDVISFFKAKNDLIGQTEFVFKNDGVDTTISAADINYGYNGQLLADQAYSVGRSDNLMSNISLILQAYLNGIYLPPSYHFSSEKLEDLLAPISKELYKEPEDALFTFQNGRVIAFSPSNNGQAVNMELLKSQLSSKTVFVVNSKKPQVITFPIPIQVLKPKIATEKANSLGIEELIGTGSSLFQGSISNRIYNITLAATRINGILVEPGEEFSFNKALGDISSFTGYKSAYIIQNGRTVLGDGGGVCQVSTTFFRALLNAGLPIIERHAHAYRVSYYEQDSPPGLDATIYVPSVDLRFKNDTGNYILIQAKVVPDIQQLTFFLYGKKDGREVILSKPVITSKTPAPAPLYQDDPTLPKGVIKQVDYSASGANVYFKREVKRDGEIIISDKFVSNYRPWQAVYLRGTKE